MSLLVIDSKYRWRTFGLRHLWSRPVEGPVLERSSISPRNNGRSISDACNSEMAACLRDETCNVINKCIISMAK